MRTYSTRKRILVTGGAGFLGAAAATSHARAPWSIDGTIPHCLRSLKSRL